MSGPLNPPGDRRKRSVPASLPRSRVSKGELFAEIIEDRRCHPSVVFSLVQRQGSPEILFLAQSRSRAGARAAVREFIADYLRSLRARPQKAGRGTATRARRRQEVARLRVESASSFVVNDYRILEGSVQVRTLMLSGQPFPGALGRWRELDPSDIARHHALGTAVSKWLQVRAREGQGMRKGHDPSS